MLYIKTLLAVHVRNPCFPITPPVPYEAIVSVVSMLKTETNPSLPLQQALQLHKGDIFLLSCIINGTDAAEERAHTGFK